jgi:mannitol/fructose-specific phosphotransferase system IIA component (Ntr-type)
MTELGLVFECVEPVPVAEEQRGDKWSLIEAIIDNSHLDTSSKPEALKDVLYREEKGSTGLSNGIAVPHARCSAVRDLHVFFTLCPEGIDFESVDSQPTHLVFTVLAPPEVSNRYLKALSGVAFIQCNRHLASRMASASDEAEALEIAGVEVSADRPVSDSKKASEESIVPPAPGRRPPVGRRSGGKADPDRSTDTPQKLPGLLKRLLGRGK